MRSVIVGSTYPGEPPILIKRFDASGEPEFSIEVDPGIDQAMQIIRLTKDEADRLVTALQRLLETEA